MIETNDSSSHELDGIDPDAPQHHRVTVCTLAPPRGKPLNDNRKR